MVNFALGWRVLRQRALVVLGWGFYLTALVIENPLIKALCLVTARALPHVLELLEDGYDLGYEIAGKACPLVS